MGPKVEALPVSCKDQTSVLIAYEADTVANSEKMHLFLITITDPPEASMERRN